MSEPSRLPTSIAARSRLSRSTNTSRIPQRSTNIPAPRRTSRNTTDLNTAPATRPRRETSLAASRRTSKPGESNIPAPKRGGSNIPGPRRTSRNTSELNTIPTTRPRRESALTASRRTSKPGESSIPAVSRRTSKPAESSIPTPRRLSRPGESAPLNSLRMSPGQSPIPTQKTSTRPADGQRRLSYTPVKQQGSRTAPCLSRHTPSKNAVTPGTMSPIRKTRIKGRTSGTVTPSTERRRAGDDSRGTTPRSGIRPVSSATNDFWKSASRFPSKLGVAEPCERGLPDRGTPSIAQSSPAARRSNNTSGVQRPALKASPYSRRTSAGGAAARGNTGGVTRKLNMAPGDETEENPAKRRLGTPGSGVRRVSGVRDTNIGMYRTDRVERDRPAARRDSGSKRSGQNALESFRAVRRASLESNEGEEKDAPMQIDMHPMQVEVPDSAQLVKTEETTMMEDVVNDLPKEMLPDRSDPITPAKITARVPTKARRISERFSEADICLDNVDQLRLSLGRRRSRGINEDVSHIATPKLRRSSLSRSLHFRQMEEEAKAKAAQAQAGEQMMIDEPDNDVFGNNVSSSIFQRSPLQSIATNRESMVGTSQQFNSVLTKREDDCSRRLSNLPRFNDDDDAWENEDVEDLGAW